MGPEQIRARLLEISAALEGIVAVDGEYTEEQMSEVETFNAEFEKLTANLATVEKMEAMKAKVAAPAPRKAAPVANVTVGKDLATSRFGGFKSTAQFLAAVKDAGSKGIIAPQFQNVMYEKNGEDGGFLVPEEMSTTIVKKLESAESLWSRAKTTIVSGNAMSFPTDESQPWNSGVTANWTAEGAPIIESKPKFGTAHLRLHKLAALVKATDELLDDATALESYILQAAPAAIMHKINNAMISGDGVGKPEGFLNSPMTLTIAKESGQAADSIVAENIINMYSHMLPTSLANSVWIGNVGAIAALNGMKNANGDYIYLQGVSQLNQSPYGTLLGRPVLPMMSGMPGLGDSGDLALVDLSYYYGIMKAGGVKSATSIHLHFDREITAFRFSMRVDGKVPFKSPVTSEFGGFVMSPFVKLADRA